MAAPGRITVLGSQINLLTGCGEDQVGVPATNLVRDCRPADPAGKVACKRSTSPTKTLLSAVLGKIVTISDEKLASCHGHEVDGGKRGGDQSWY